MNKTWRELFADLFDPKLPLLFFVAALALSVAGTALANVMTAIIGTGIISQTAIFVGAAGVLGGALVGFRYLLQRVLQHARVARYHVPAERQAEPAPLLVMLVGTNANGPEDETLSWHARGQVLQQAWLLATEASYERARGLVQYAGGLNVRTEIVSVGDGFTFADAYLGATTAIRAAQQIAGGRTLVVDITASTAIVSSGAAVAARDAAVALTYLLRPQTADNRPDLRVPGTAMLIAAPETTP